MKVSWFRTQDFRPHQRVEAWSELIWSSIGRLITQVNVGEEFGGQVRFGDADGLKVCRATIETPHQVTRTPELIRRDDRGVLKVVFQLKGRAAIQQCGRQLTLNPGEWTIYDASQPYVVINPEGVEFLAMLVPREMLTKVHKDVSRYTLLRSSSVSGLGRLICGYLGVLLDDASEFDADMGRQLADSAIDLVQLAVAQYCGRERSALSAAISKERIKAYISRHVRDPEFSIGTIAEVMHCSKRHLHKLFHEDGDTISHFLWNTRLDRCRADLGNPELRSKPITTIAFSWGFNNAAHFSRCFKARFGMSPTEYRLSNAAEPSTQMSGVWYAQALSGFGGVSLHTPGK